jgi:hypothetical protein
MELYLATRLPGLRHRKRVPMRRCPCATKLLCGLALTLNKEGYEFP